MEFIRKFRPYLQTLRISHWVKNSFIFIPSFFAGSFFHPEIFTLLIAAFICYSLVASGIYIINDINDLKEDRLHPVKKNRSLASGRVSVTWGIIIMSVCLTVGLVGAYLIKLQFLYLCLTYLTLNLSYSFGLKKVAILDLLIISSGFLIRVYAGGIVADVAVSHWLSIMIFLLSLFLVLAKRRDDIRIYEADGTLVRKSSLNYNNDFINSCITMVSGIIIVSYILYTVSPEITQQWGSEYIFATTIFVVAGLMRYLQLTMVEHKSGSPVRILYKDRFIIFTLLGWIISFSTIIYF